MIQTWLIISHFLCPFPCFYITSLSLSCGVPHGTILGPILFNMYTTPLSTLISSLNHRLYANDIQLFISFAPTIYITAISQLQDTISDIWFWMTSNILSLNASKTEFMLIGLAQQISKIFNRSHSLPSNPLYPLQIARYLGSVSSLIQVSHFLNRFHLYVMLATTISATFVASGTLSTSKQHLLPLLILYILN